MFTMAVLARHGNVQPNVYAEMDDQEAHDLAMRVAKMHNEEFEARANMDLERTKAMIKALGARVMA